jgi:hypothetical protein
MCQKGGEVEVTSVNHVSGVEAVAIFAAYYKGLYVRMGILRRQKGVERYGRIDN